MADRSLVDRKFDASKQLVQSLKTMGAPLLAAYWELHEEDGGWLFFLVPRSVRDESKLIDAASSLLVEPPYRSIFSLIDVQVDSHQIERARALGSYIRSESYVGRDIDTTFTGGHYFESVVPVHFAPELLTHLRVA